MKKIFKSNTITTIIKLSARMRLNWVFECLILLLQVRGERKDLLKKKIGGKRK